MKVICIYSSENKTYSSPVFTDDVENGCRFIINNLVDTFKDVSEKAKNENSNDFIKNLPSLICEKSSYMSIYLVGDFDITTGEFINDKQLLVEKINLPKILADLNIEREIKEKEKKDD